MAEIPYLQDVIAKSIANGKRRDRRLIVDLFRQETNAQLIAIYTEQNEGEWRKQGLDPSDVFEAARLTIRSRALTTLEMVEATAEAKEIIRRHERHNSRSFRFGLRLRALINVLRPRSHSTH